MVFVFFICHGLLKDKQQKSVMMFLLVHCCSKFIIALNIFLLRNVTLKCYKKLKYHIFLLFLVFKVCFVNFQTLHKNSQDDSLISQLLGTIRQPPPGTETTL